MTLLDLGHSRSHSPSLGDGGSSEGHKLLLLVGKNSQGTFGDLPEVPLPPAEPQVTPGLCFPGAHPKMQLLWGGHSPALAKHHWRGSFSRG